jgi:hypothetical protein
MLNYTINVWSTRIAQENGAVSGFMIMAHHPFGL